MELGLFILLLGLALLFSFLGMRTTENTGSMFKIIAVAMWAILAVVLGSGEGVIASVESVNNDTGETWNTTRTFIEAGESGYWMAYIFTGLAIYNLAMFVKQGWQAAGKGGIE